MTAVTGPARPSSRARRSSPAGLPALPDPKTHRLYFDHGSETLDAVYKRYQDRVDAVVERRGYVPGRNWLTRSFPGQKHNEISWASRVDMPLQFLLPRK